MPCRRRRRLRIQFLGHSFLAVSFQQFSFRMPIACQPSLLVEAFSAMIL
jgi:hypothetical protein